MKNKYILFDFSGTLVKMRPPELLVRRSLLETLSQIYHLGVITGGRKREVINILTNLKIADQFKFVNAKDDCCYLKPDKKLYLFLKAKYKIQKAIYLGDTTKDFTFAKNANLPFLYIGKRKIGITNNSDINKLLLELLNNRDLSNLTN